MDAGEISEPQAQPGCGVRDGETQSIAQVGYRVEAFELVEFLDFEHCGGWLVMGRKRERMYKRKRWGAGNSPDKGSVN